MINLKSILSIARAETRVTRRLVRYWMFIGVAYLVIFVLFLLIALLHRFLSTQSATMGIFSPRFLVSIMDLYLTVYSIGVIFLAFDVRARDRRERMHEVLDSRPYSNLDLVLGRYLGTLIPAWVPIVIMGILIQALGLILKGSGSPIGEPIEPYSLISFLFFNSLPALSFAISAVFLITLLVKNRLISSVILVLALGGVYFAMNFLPIYQAKVLDFTGSLQSLFPSDIIHSFLRDSGGFQRAAIFLVSIGFLIIAAAIHPRLDDRSGPRLLSSGIVITAAAAVILLFIFWDTRSAINIKDVWLNAHRAVSEAPVPDIKKISGQINVAPGKSLDMNIDILFKAPDSGSIKNAIFTLNPGQKVTEVIDSSGQSLSFTHENGLLDITLPQALAQGNETAVKLSIAGIPDKNFAYLDSVLDYRAMKANSNGNLLLGTENYLFDSRFVALMPGVRWLPASGTEFERDNRRVRPLDFFDVDLTVRVPKGWLAAGPGKRQTVEESQDYSLFRFSPPSVVSEVGLIASDFESRSFEAEDVVLELLIHKVHTRNLDILSDAGEKVKEYISGKLKEAADEGLPYPYDGLTMVEVPALLRGFGGGWRLDTSLTFPGVMLLKEVSLPTARFDSEFRKPERFKDVEGDAPQVKFGRIMSIFRNDYSGGNALTGVSKNFFGFQTNASGPDSLALNFTMDTLTGLAITGEKGYFSAHLYSDKKQQSAIGAIINNFEQLRGVGGTMTNATITAMTSRPVVWERALETSLKDMDPWEDPADSLNVLTLKGYAISDSIYAYLGREKTVELLSIIRKNHKGGSYNANDVIAAGKEAGIDLTELLGDWIGSTGLPGFVVSETEAYRIPDDENGSSRYQVLISVRNDEPVPGLFYFAFFYPNERYPNNLVISKPVRLAGHQALRYGQILSKLPDMYFLNPYLSLNRKGFKFSIDTFDHDKIVNKEPIEGSVGIPWEIPISKSVTVDDLDEGFSVVEDEKKDGLRLKSRENTDGDLDRGLFYLSFDMMPAVTPAPKQWSRMTSTAAWGKYRHTAALIRGGKGNKKARFTADLVKGGSWDLEIHLPLKSVFPRKKWGTWNIVVKDSNGDEYNLNFNSDTGNEGWNILDKLNLPEGKVTVELSNDTDGNIVVADAVKWTPSEGN